MTTVELVLLVIGAAAGAAAVVIGAAIAGALRERAARSFWERQARLLVLNWERSNRPAASRQEVKR
jgi:hypothetical protein